MKSIHNLKRIDDELIYPLQKRLGLRAMTILARNTKRAALCKRTPIIALQMQQGKTGVMAVLIYLFISDCVRRKKTFQVVVLCGLSETSLREQSKDRLCGGVDHEGDPMGARLGDFAKSTKLAKYGNREQQREGILVLNNTATLKNLRLSDNVDIRLILCDEVHIGNGKNGNIDTFLRNHGVKVSEQIHTWKDGGPINQLVGVSATPFAHHIFADGVGLKGEALFTAPLYEEPEANYNSLEKMYEKGRLRQSESLFDKKGNPTTFTLKVLADFETYRTGYLVIRALGKTHRLLMEYLSLSGRIQVKEFDSKMKNLNDLADFLSKPRQERIIVVIRGTMRAGMTIRTGKYIRAWVENPNSTNTDTAAQSAFGRACGYNKTGEVYPIYGDLAKAEEMIKYYQEVQRADRDLAIPSGIQSKSTHGKVVQRHPIVRIVSAEEGHMIQNALRSKGRRKGERDRNQAQLVCVSTNFKNNIAEFALQDRRDSGATIGVYVDKRPSEATRKQAIIDAKKRHVYVGNERFYTRERLAELQQSYDQLIRQRPDLEGMVGLYGDTPVEVVMGRSNDRVSYQRSGSALTH